MSLNLSFQNWLLLLGLAFFFGLAFEEFYASRAGKRPGGIRTFPLLAMIGAGLYLLEPDHAIAFSTGLFILGLWLFAYYRDRIMKDEKDKPGDPGLIAPVCNLLAYVLGPIVLLAPLWIPVGIIVSAVLFLGARERLHSFARSIPSDEITTLGKFLILTGIILPLLPDEPVTSLTPITPYQVWLAVAAVSSLSYGSYLVQRYISPERGVLPASVLGGLYSSTATTVVLARRIRDQGEPAHDLKAGIVLSTSVMYLRLWIVIAVFNGRLARICAPPLVILCVLGVLLAGILVMRSRRSLTNRPGKLPRNPLDLNTAVIFAALFVLMSLATAWVKASFGQAGIYGFAALVGVTDIDPFVLGLAQGSAQALPLPGTAAAILIAASSNNLLKGAYTLAFAGRRTSLVPIGMLAVLAAAGLGFSLWMINGYPL